jgi:hypothetical protein
MSSRSGTRCIPLSVLVPLVVCILVVGVASMTAATSAGPIGSHTVSASVRAVQPAVSGLFQVHAPRKWVDVVDESGAALANGVPDFLDGWDAFDARTSWAVLKNGYAFTTIDGLGHEVLYAGVQWAPGRNVNEVSLEFNQSPGERLLGDLGISIEILDAGEIGAVRFARFAVDADGVSKFVPVAILAGEGCNDAGSACIVANGALLEIGYNETLLGKPDKGFAGIRFQTPEDQASGRLSPMFSSGTADCVKEIGAVNNPVCTAGDVRLGEIVEGTLVVTEGCNGATCSGGTRDGLGCNYDSDCPGGGTCPDFVSFTAIAKFTAGPQRYDVGVYFSSDGDPNHDGARSGDCSRFALPRTGKYCLGGDIEAKSCNGNADCTGTSPTPNGTCLSYVNLDGDTCGDMNANQILEAPVAVTIKCADNNADQKVDIFHCETWGQNSSDVLCGSGDPGQYVKSGTPSKCDCSLLLGPGSCIPAADNDPCTVAVCQGTCSNSSSTTCTTDANCLIGGVQGQCQGITLRQIPGNDGAACGSSSDTACDNPDTCLAGACVANKEAAGTTCGAASGECNPADTCDANGNCVTNVAENGTACGGAPSECDLQDTCQSGVCTDAGHKGAGAACGSSSDTECDNPDSCNASGVCVSNNVGNGTNCGDTAGECQNQATCQAGSCTGGGNKGDGTACGSSADTLCDNPDTCLSGACQPNHEPSTTVCRGRANTCDAAEFCDGDGNCPGDLCLGGESPISLP